MTHVPSIAATLVKSRLRYWQANGLSLAALQAQTSIDLSDLQPLDRVELIEFNHLYSFALSQLKNQSMGLEIGLQTVLGDIGLLGAMVMYVRDGWQTYELLVEYFSLVSDGHDLTLTRTDADVRLLLLKKDNSSLSNHYIDSTLVSIVRLSKLLQGSFSEANYVLNLTHDGHGVASRYQEISNVTVNLNQSRNELVIPAAVLDQKNPNHDVKRLNDVLQEADALLLRSQRVVTLSFVKRKSRDMLLEGDLTQVGLAECLQLNIRKLQRILQQYNTNFRTVKEQIKQEIACELILDNQLNMKDIAHLLGYAEPNAFFKAFKRWTGSTPGEFKANNRTLETSC
ncbi:MAG: AraC family transcriptional regulator ligand-binding domain-containing protein [Pseudomonadales bacterium]|nr:AraC family transcriptional regulator ligand-binding domain-containing protein [Pseudomonadales bacterium]